MKSAKADELAMIPRFLLGKETLHLILTAEVKFLVGACYYIRIPLSLQFPDYGRTDHAAMPGNIDFGILFHHNVSV